MLTSSLPITISLWQPLHLRVRRRIADAAQALWLALLCARQEHALRVQHRYEWSGLTDLSAHTLKDIGAPDWVVQNAADRRDMARPRRDEFSHRRGV